MGQAKCTGAGQDLELAQTWAQEGTQHWAGGGGSQGWGLEARHGGHSARRGESLCPVLG